MNNVVKIYFVFFKQENLRYTFEIWLTLLIIMVLVTKSSETFLKRNIQGDDCINLNFQNDTIPKFSSSEKCISLWSLTHCKGNKIGHMGVGRSASGCSKCRKKEMNGGVLCTGPKDNQNCTKLDLVCHQFKPKFQTLIQETEEAGVNVPITIEKLNMSEFTVYQQGLEGRSSKQRPIPFIAFHKSKPNKAMDANTVKFGKKARVVFYIHGYATEDLEDGIRIKNSLFSGARDATYFVIVDWRKWSLPSENSNYLWPPNYKIVALQNLPVVSDRVQKFLVSKLRNDNYIYIVGFSLGAHVAGTAARRAARKRLTVDRITALDAAGPIFEYSSGLFKVDSTNILRKSDAKFVDLIHTTELIGLRRPAGHLDIYLKENRCVAAPCKHRRGIDLYMSSLSRCSLITCPRNGRGCSQTTVSEFGYLADRYPGRGEHDLTIITSKFKWRDNDCNPFFNLYLPAKDRVCHRPPDKLSKCRNKPYLTECNVDCSGKRPSSVTATVVCAHKANVGIKSVDQYELGTWSTSNITIEARSSKVRWYQRRAC